MIRVAKSKYSEVENWIKNEIYRARFADGDKIPSENKLMEQFGYSRQTIRQALRNLEEKGFLKSVRGSGTYVDMSKVLGGKEKKNIAVILNNLDRPEEMKMLSAIENVLTQNNCTISLGITHNRHDREYEVLQSMIESGVDGFIIEGVKTAVINPNHELLLKLNASVPCVFVNCGNVALNIPAVACDEMNAGYIATKYLIERGHRHIAAISRMDSLVSHRRYVGYIRALHEAGIPFDDNNIMWCLFDDIEDSFFERLFRNNKYKCTALLCHNAIITMRLMDFLKKKGLKPFDDISIISYDNSKNIQENLITSVDSDRYKIGEEAAKLCLKPEDSGIRREILVRPQIIERDSVRSISVEVPRDEEM